MEAVKGAGNQGRGKDIANIVQAEREEAAKAENGEIAPRREEEVICAEINYLMSVSRTFALQLLR